MLLTGLPFTRNLVGRAWVKLGHQLRVFSAQKHPDARPTFQKDEDFVIRHFSVDEVIPVTRSTYFDPSRLLNEEYEVFVAQNVERLPAQRLLEVFPEIKKRAVTIQVVHEGKAPEDPLYYKFDWDAIVCFDQRYKDYLVKFDLGRTEAFLEDHKAERIAGRFVQLFVE